MLTHWNLIESDFQREYRLNIAENLPTMSWRRFSALLQGLGPDSAYRLTLQNGAQVIDGADAEAHVESLLG